MRSFTVREVQHHLASLLRAVERGEEIEIRRRKRPIARIVPLRERVVSVRWSGVKERLEAIYGKRRVSGEPASEIVRKGRGDW